MERLLALIRQGFKEAEPDCKTHPGQTRSHTPNPCRGFPTLVRGIAAAGEASGQGRLPVVPVSGSGLGSGRGSAEGRGRIACGLPVEPLAPSGRRPSSSSGRRSAGMRILSGVLSFSGGGSPWRRSVSSPRLSAA